MTWCCWSILKIGHSSSIHSLFELFETNGSGVAGWVGGLGAWEG
jgi:hypothetical protein